VYTPVMTAVGGQMFKNLAPGSYRAILRTQGYVPASTTFQVKPGRTARATIKLVKGGKLIFRAGEPDGNPLPGFPWIGYRITKAGSDKPLLEDERGPLWGSLLFLSESAPRTASLQLAPGAYDVTAVLRSERERRSLCSDTNLWSTSRTINIVSGKDAVIEMGWKE